MKSKPCSHEAPARGLLLSLCKRMVERLLIPRPVSFPVGNHQRTKPNRAPVRLATLVVMALTPLSLRAEVVRFDVTDRQLFADGHEFGSAGAYERIIGRVHYAIDPALPQNRAIVDLRHAPRNAAGMVEFSSDLFILAPQDLRRASGAALYGVNNRGRGLTLRFFNDAPQKNDPKTKDDAGNGFLFRHGWIVVWSGWDGELLPGAGLLRLYTPVAKRDGSPINGPVRYETSVQAPGTRANINTGRDNHGAYRPTQEGQSGATLTWRLRPGDPRVPIPRDQFRLEVTDVEPVASGQLPRVELVVPAGLEPGYLYEVIYEAQDPLVHGVCFASVRDLMTALKHGDGKDHPLLLDGRPVVARNHAFGVSQSGRFLRELLYWGFNEDEQGRQVFDGVIPHVAGGGLGSFNHRFSQPTAFNTQHELQDFVSDRFPFAYGEQYDPFTKQLDGILRRAVSTKTAPLVMHTQSSAEYWTRSGSLPHTDPAGTRDAVVPDKVRFYSFGGTQHGPASWPPGRGSAQQMHNPGNYRPLLRALLLALDRWANNEIPPPAVYPRIQDGTLVAFQQSQSGFPSIPGVRFPEVILMPSVLDFGTRWQSSRIMDVLPPRKLGSYQALVPASDADGNDRGCLLPPEVAVPLATHTGWNLRHRHAGAENELVGLVGSYLPLPRNEDERRALGDPRPSLEARYGSLSNYLKELRSHCMVMVRDGYLLEEDVARVVQRQEEIARPLFEKP